MTNKETIKLIDKLIEQKRIDFGKGCKEVAIDCASCSAQRLEDYLVWWKDALEFSENDEKTDDFHDINPLRKSMQERLKSMQMGDLNDKIQELCNVVNEIRQLKD